MDNEACLPDKSQIAREILTYLRRHPDAQDTVDGISRGWLPGLGNKYKQTMVQEVLKDLVLEGTILESKIPGLKVVYRLNNAKRNRLKELLEKKD